MQNYIMKNYRMKKNVFLRSAFLCSALLLTGLSTSTFAGNKEVKESLMRIGMPEELIHIEDSNLPNWKKVTIQGNQYFVTEDGAYLIQGPVFNIQGKTPLNINNATNAKLLASIKDQAIVYKAKKQKYEVYIFTDYSCGYCKKLHEEIQTYLNNGITVYYFAFPRAGAGTDSAKLMQQAWNAADQKQALTALYQNESAQKAEDTTQVDHFYNIGVELGITGTPSIFLMDGQMLSGYIPADKLLSYLEDSN